MTASRTGRPRHSRKAAARQAERFASGSRQLHQSPDRLRIASLLFAVSLFAMTLISGTIAAVAVALGLGVSYAMIVSLFNATAQAMFPSEMRARAISIYFIGFYGVLALSSSIWGKIAEARGMELAFRGASVLLVAAALSVLFWPSRSEKR